MSQTLMPCTAIQNSRQQEIQPPFTLRALIADRKRLPLRQILPILDVLATAARKVDPHPGDPFPSLDRILIDSDGRALVADLEQFSDPWETEGNSRSRSSSPAPDVSASSPSSQQIRGLAAITAWMLTGDQEIASAWEMPSERDRQAADTIAQRTDEFGQSVSELLIQNLIGDGANHLSSATEFVAQLRARRNNVGEFQLLQRLGQGMTGTVYAAKDKTGNKVAIKVLDKSFGHQVARQCRFYQEAKLCMELDHPNLIRVWEVGFDRGLHYMAMELLEGVNLEQYVRQYGSLPENESLRIIREIAKAVAALHARGVVHRDINPANVFVGWDGQIKLLDLGLCKTDQLELTEIGRGLGTPQYISPEQFRGANQVTAPADVYGLGATLYWMLTGCEPFVGNDPYEQLKHKMCNQYPSPREVNASLSTATCRLVQQAMAARPQDRPHDVLTFDRAAATCLLQLRETSIPAARNPHRDCGRNWKAIFFTDRGERKQTQCSEVQIARLLEQGVLNGDARVAPADDEIFRPLRDINELRPLLKRQTTLQRWIRSWTRLLRDLRKQTSRWLQATGKRLAT